MQQYAEHLFEKYFRYRHLLVLGARFDERGRVTDAGMDLNDPSAFGEYCKDVIILTVFSQVIAASSVRQGRTVIAIFPFQIVALYSTYAYLILLLIPAAATYKVFSLGVLDINAICT